MLVGDLYAMNNYMNDIALDTFEQFLMLLERERVKNTTRKNFYHGFVLGHMVR